MIKKAALKDAEIIASLAIQLWKEHTLDELTEEFSELIKQKETAVFLAEEDNLPVGFAQCQLRHDYVEGTESSPVGYLEGIFVRKEYRHSGIGKELCIACENWARSLGCKEFASDCELTNRTSLAFHLKIGFTEANRIICFTKKL